MPRGTTCSGINSIIDVLIILDRLSYEEGRRSNLGEILSSAALRENLGEYLVSLRAEKSLVHFGSSEVSEAESLVCQENVGLGGFLESPWVGWVAVGVFVDALFDKVLAFSMEIRWSRLCISLRSTSICFSFSSLAFSRWRSALTLAAKFLLCAI